MTIHPIRKYIHKFGFDFHRYRPQVHRLTLLQSLGISTVIDVGANTGQFAREIRELLPDACIYSFEPIKDCYQALVDAMSGDSKFKAFNFALGASSHESSIHRSAYNPSSSILDMDIQGKLLFPYTTEHTMESIVVRRFDEIAELPLDRLDREILLKIDTEGYESQVLEGAASLLAKAKVVIIENSYISRYQGQALFDDIYMTMKNAGLSYRGAWQQKINPKTGEVIFEDSVFFRI